MSKFHGIEENEDGEPEWLHHAAIRLIDCISTPENIPDDAPELVRQWWSLEFLNAAKKLRDTIWKFDYAARRADECEAKIKAWERLKSGEYGDGISMNDPRFTERMQALNDLTLYTDLLFFYLRIQADALAAIVPYLYDKPGQISTSFRKQRQWFKNTRPDFDPEYSRIVSAELPWFEHLSGRQPRGLRDAIVHYGATYQIGVKRDTDTDEVDICTGVVGKKGYLSENARESIRDIHHGWCEFLDVWFEYFSSRLQPVTTWVDFQEPAISHFAHITDATYGSDWVYPRIASLHRK